MIRCQNCGHNNSDTGNFCRFCGAKFLPNRNDYQSDYEKVPPRPYSWQTDELQLKKHSARKTQQINRVQPVANNRFNTNQPLVSPNQNQSLQPQYQNQLSSGYHCPFCNTNSMPLVVKKVSAAGWAVFAVLLVTTFIFFWIGLLMQEERRICPVCNMRVG